MDPALCEQQTEAQALAAALGLKTGNQVPPPRKGPQIAPHEEARARWSKLKKAVFAVVEPAALCLVATDGPISVTKYDAWGQPVNRIGHNRGVWPARLVKTASWRDTATATWDKSPLPDLEVASRWRIWTPDVEARDTLAEAVVEVLARITDERGSAVKMREGWSDLGPAMDLPMLEAEVHALAERLGIRTRDDAALEAYLDKVAGRVQALLAASPGVDVEALIERVIGRG